MVRHCRGETRKYAKSVCGLISSFAGARYIFASSIVKRFLKPARRRVRPLITSVDASRERLLEEARADGELATMTEKWVSQPKHWCTICKVWIDAKKISINIHETGRGHKEKLEQHLEEQRRRRTNTSLGKSELDAELRAIEAAAAASFAQDVEAGVATGGPRPHRVHQAPPPHASHAPHSAAFGAGRAGGFGGGGGMMEQSSTAAGIVAMYNKKYGHEEATPPPVRHRSATLMCW